MRVQLPQEYKKFGSRRAAGGKMRIAEVNLQVPVIIILYFRVFTNYYFQIWKGTGPKSFI